MKLKKEKPAMKIALVGYGKMGHMIEQAAKRAGHEVVTTIDVMAEDAKVKVAAGDTDSIVRAIVLLLLKQTVMIVIFIITRKN